ncbi:MAG: TonB-dependent receptor [Opitutaceae bacterium]|nr:TonB-dependent receptor [Opitutaceae bacterium]
MSLPVGAAESAPAGTGQQVGSIGGRVKNAVTGQYLNRARVTIRGTAHLVYTDEDGAYQLGGVPSGPVVLEVFYTDLDPQEIALQLPAGGSVERDVELTSQARYGASAEVVKLDPFMVASIRETDAETIATHEQRFSSNIKNVLNTDALGDLVGNDAGEFLKYLPGLVAEYAEGDIGGISVRGIGAEMTSVNFDDAPIVTGHNGSTTRLVDMRSQSLNNIARIEVTKVPTPATPADSLAGSVNMISKSAFERSRAEFRYSLYLAGNGDDLTLKKTPHADGDKNTYKTQPGFDFDYTLPLNKDLGIVVTGMQSHKYTPQNRSATTWAFGGTATGASATNPYFQQFSPRAGPRSKSLTAFSAKADWRVTPHSVLSVGARWSKNIAARTGQISVTVNAGTVGDPTPANGVPLRFSPTETIGATGRGSVTASTLQQYSVFNNEGTNLKYRFDDGRWRIESNLNYSASETLLNPLSSSRSRFFGTSTAVLANPVRISFLDITRDGPGDIQAFNNANQAVDIYDIRNYRLSATNEDRRRQVRASTFGKLDVRRRLEVFPFPSAVQVGALYRRETADRRTELFGWTPAAANNPPAAYMHQVYVRQEMYNRWPFPSIDGVRAWSAFENDPTLFTQTPVQIVGRENTRLNTSQYAEETVTSYYVQGEARLLANRLHVLAGVRFEETDVGGEGVLVDPDAVYVRNANGTFAHNAQGARIRKPEAGAANSLQEVALTRKERGYTAERTYDDFFPSVHLTYSVRENLLVRAAYARTYGRPNFPDIIPTATVRSADLGEDQIGDPSVIQGDITVTNTGLRPWTADNYDLSVEYYTQQGGLFSAGVFRKDITDFWGTEVRIATPAILAEVGLDDDYVGWNVESLFNSGDARVSGIEFNLRQSLRNVGKWGRHFTVFANATRLWLEGNPHATFNAFVPKTANWGFTFAWKRLTVMPKWNYVGRIKRAATPGVAPDAFQYSEPRTLVDLGLAYRLTQRLSLTANVNNLFNAHMVRTRYGAETPEYAQLQQDFEYGALFSVGIKGSF